MELQDCKLKNWETFLQKAALRVVIKQRNSGWRFTKSVKNGQK
jgi:hypothetical protein